MHLLNSSRLRNPIQQSIVGTEAERSQKFTGSSPSNIGQDVPESVRVYTERANGKTIVELSQCGFESESENRAAAD